MVLALVVVLSLLALLPRYDLVFRRREQRGPPNDPYRVETEVSVGLRPPADEQLVATASVLTNQTPITPPERT